MSWDGLVNMSDRIRVLNSNRVYRTVCIEYLLDDRTHRCCFDSCYLACDAILMKIIDMGFCGSIPARGLERSTMAGGIRMSWDGWVNICDRIRVLKNNRAYKTVCIE